MAESKDIEQKLDNMAMTQLEEGNDNPKRESFEVNEEDSLKDKKTLSTHAMESQREREDESADVMMGIEGEQQITTTGDEPPRNKEASGQEEKISSEELLTNLTKSDKQEKPDEDIQSSPRDQSEGCQKCEVLIPPDLNALLKANIREVSEELKSNIPESRGIQGQQTQRELLKTIQNEPSQPEVNEENNILPEPRVDLVDNANQNSQIEGEKLILQEDEEKKEAESTEAEIGIEISTKDKLKYPSLQPPDINLLLKNFNMKPAEGSETILQSEPQNQPENRYDESQEIQKDDTLTNPPTHSEKIQTEIATQETNSQNIQIPQALTSLETIIHSTTQANSETTISENKQLIAPDLNELINKQKEAQEKDPVVSEMKAESIEFEKESQSVEADNTIQKHEVLPAPDLNMLLKAANKEEGDGAANLDFSSKEESTGFQTEKTQPLENLDATIGLIRPDETDKNTGVKHSPQRMKIPLKLNQGDDLNTKVTSDKKEISNHHENPHADNTSDVVTSSPNSKKLVPEDDQHAQTARTQNESAVKTTLFSARESHQNSGVWESNEKERPTYRNKSFERASSRGDKKTTLAEKLTKAKPPSNVFEKYIELKKAERKKLENLGVPQENTQKFERRSPSPTQKTDFNPDTLANLKLAEELLKKYKPSSLASSKVLSERLQELQRKKAQEEAQKAKLDRDSQKLERNNEKVSTVQSKATKTEKTTKTMTQTRNLNKSLDRYGNKGTKLNLDEQRNQLFNDPQLQGSSSKKQSQISNKALQLPLHEVNNKNHEQQQQPKTMTKGQFDVYYDRMVEFEIKKQEKLEQLKKQKEDEERKKRANSKTPSSYSAKKGEQNEPFHKRIDTYMKQKREKLQELQKKAEEDKAKKEESELTFTPKINKISNPQMNANLADGQPHQTPEKGIGTTSHSKPKSTNGENKRVDVSQGDLEIKKQNHLIPTGYIINLSEVRSKDPKLTNSISSKEDPQGNLTATFEQEEIPSTQILSATPVKPSHSLEPNRSRTAKKTPTNYQKKAIGTISPHTTRTEKKSRSPQKFGGSSQFECSLKENRFEDAQHSSTISMSRRRSGSPLSSARNVESVMNKYEHLFSSPDTLESERTPTYEEVLQKIAKMKEKFQNKNAFKPTINPISTKIVNSKRQALGQYESPRRQSPETTSSIDPHLANKPQHKGTSFGGKDTTDASSQQSITYKNNEIRPENKVNNPPRNVTTPSKIVGKPTRSCSVSITPLDISSSSKADGNNNGSKNLQIHQSNLTARTQFNKMHQEGILGQPVYPPTTEKKRWK